MISPHCLKYVAEYLSCCSTSCLLTVLMSLGRYILWLNFSTMLSLKKVCVTVCDRKREGYIFMVLYNKFILCPKGACNSRLFYLERRCACYFIRNNHSALFYRSIAQLLMKYDRFTFGKTRTHT